MCVKSVTFVSDYAAINESLSTDLEYYTQPDKDLIRTRLTMSSHFDNKVKEKKKVKKALNQ